MKTMISLIQTFARCSSSYSKKQIMSLNNGYEHPEELSSKFTTKTKSMVKPYTVVVEGNIGAGKTTFLKAFSQNYSDKVEIFAEPIERWRNCQGHNLLQLMYQDPSRHSLTLQTFVQLTMTEIHNCPTEKPIKLLERSLLSARYCFVENLRQSNLMSSSEFSVIDEWFKYLTQDCSYLDFNIDLIIYLRTKPEVSYGRILARNRTEENQVPMKYIQDLHNLHEEWLVDHKSFQPLPAPVIVVDANDDLSVVMSRYSQLVDDVMANGLLQHQYRCPAIK